MTEHRHYDSALPPIGLTAEEISLIRAALSAYIDSVEHVQKVILGADLEVTEVKTALRRLHAKLFQVNMAEGRRF